MKSILLLILLIVLSPLPLPAEPVEIASSLSLEQTVATALRDNASLRALRAKWAAMQERPAQATTLPNPMFQYGGMDTTDRGRWPNTEEKRFMLEQEIPWPGKLGLRGKIAGKEADAMGREYETMRADVILMVKETYFDLYAVQQTLTLTRADADVLNRMEQLARAKLEAAAAGQTDVLKAETEVTMLQARVLELEQQEATLKAKLNQLLNRPPDSPLGLAVTAPAAGEVIPVTRPEIKQAEATLQRNELERQLMRREFFPDYRLGVEYRSFRSDADMVMFTIGFDLPIWQRKYRAAAREAGKMVESAQAALEATRRQTEFDARDAQFKLATARRTLELYRTALLPQAEARFKASEAGYRAGTADFLDLLESQRFLLNVRTMTAMAEGNLGTQLARLERAGFTGVSEQVGVGAASPPRPAQHIAAETPLPQQSTEHQ